MNEPTTRAPARPKAPDAPRQRPVWFEVSDAIWLAGHMVAAASASDTASPQPPPSPSAAMPPGGRPSAGGGDERPADGGADPDTAAGRLGIDGEARAHAPPPREHAREPAGVPSSLNGFAFGTPARPARPGERPNGSHVRVPRPGGLPYDDPFAGVHPLPDRRRIEQALRPFRKPVPSVHGAPELDEEATAVRAVQDDLWLPETRPALERWLDIDVVVDDGPLSALTRPVADAFIDCVGRVGAFRTIHTYLLDTDRPGLAEPLLRPAARPSAARPAARLIGRGRRERRLLVVLTDGVGRAWHSGTAQRLLAGWGRQVPLVVINLLARRQWRRTGLVTRPARLYASTPAAANRSYRVRYPSAPWGDGAPRLPAGRPVGDEPWPPAVHDTGAPGPSQVHIPVIELNPGQLAGWARFVAEPNGSWLGAVAVCDTRSVGRSPSWHPDDDEDTAAPPASASELVRRFRAAVSPTVFSLAVHLAAAPLNAPVMRLVQRTMLPQSRPSDLAEVVGSGLVRRVGTGRAPGSEAPEEVTLDFVPGVRDELLANGRRSDTTQVLLMVGRHLGDRVAGLRDLMAMVTEPEQAEPPEIGAELVPFAVPTLHVLRALAGPYLRAARELESRLPGSAGGFGSAAATPNVDQRSTTPPLNANDAGRNGPMQTQMLDAAAADGAVVTQDVAKPPPLGVGVTIRNIPQVTDRKPSDPPPVWGNVPPQNINFTGREKLLEQLHERLSQGTTAVLPQALHGMGGVGKSQIAIEYVYRHTADYDLIWWIRSERPGQIQQDLTELAAALNLPVSQEVNVAVPAVREALRLGRPYRNWLLIFDNAEELEEVRQFFPTNGPGKILVTSRNQAWTKVAKSLEVDVFAREESKALLRLRGPEISDEAADELAEVLGDLPLAIAQAAVWLAETGMPVDEYLHLFKEKHEKATELLYDSAPAPYELPVAAAWNVSLDRLRSSEPAALQLLQVCAFFAPEPISLRLLSGARNVEGPPELLEALGDPVRLGRAIRAINQYALAKISHKHNTIQLHRLVQRVLVSQLDPDEAAVLRRCGHQLMAKFDPEDPVVPTNWQRYADLLPHVLYSRVVESDDVWARQLVLNEIDFLFQWGDHKGFLELAEEAVNTWTRTLGPDHDQTLAAELHLGRALRLHGRFEEAYQHHMRVFEVQQRAHGADDERTLEAQRFVAADLRYLGQFDRALEYDRQNHETLRRMYGPEDPITLEQAHLYAISLRLTGDFWGARELDRETYQHLVTIFGETHARALSSQAAIAWDEMECGDYETARELTRRNVQRLRTTFGDSFAGLAEALSAQSVMERKAGDHERALELSTEALDRYHSRYGSFHPSSMSAALNHAVNLRQVGRLDESIKLTRETAQNFLKMFGPDHPNTATADINLAVVLRLNGQTDEARRLDEAALEVLTRMVGPDHPRTIICSINLASDLCALGHPEDALERDRETLARARRVLGDHHPTALACEFNHARDLHAVGEVEEAETLTAQAIDRLRRVHGPNHPATLSAQQGMRADCDIYPIPV
ncbi:cytochrome c [Actinomadura sp. NBRC 104425]|uniref:FxSxx-COOH system tetratricopeptide repeat protein n=1 Tax=Actinomadura sp. NBRC 104425 TaxID=3032204 RepID=UPI0024A43DD1|nr:FxSxx-COOH system tetratricopeptide repeat protein [Actinomadura sp. NBRC 104425]GLZ14372.1 cytochrome c [Actinomadura sp. NBRC 104425]